MGADEVEETAVRTLNGWTKYFLYGLVVVVGLSVGLGAAWAVSNKISGGSKDDVAATKVTQREAQTPAAAKSDSSEEEQPQGKRAQDVALAYLQAISAGKGDEAKGLLNIAGNTSYLSNALLSGALERISNVKAAPATESGDRASVAISYVLGGVVNRAKLELQKVRVQNEKQWRIVKGIEKVIDERIVTGESERTDEYPIDPGFEAINMDYQVGGQAVNWYDLNQTQENKQVLVWPALYRVSLLSSPYYTTLGAEILVNESGIQAKREGDEQRFSLVGENAEKHLIGVLSPQLVQRAQADIFEKINRCRNSHDVEISDTCPDSIGPSGTLTYLFYSLDNTVKCEPVAYYQYSCFTNQFKFQNSYRGESGIEVSDVALYSAHYVYQFNDVNSEPIASHFYYSHEGWEN